MCLIFTYLGCYAAMYVYETTIRDIDYLLRRLMQIWFALNMTLSTLHLISGTTD